MLIDITLEITREMLRDAKANEKEELLGHLGTHFDIMDKSFPLEYTKRKGILFDVRGIYDREISLADIDIGKVEGDMAVLFFTGFIEKEPYGSREYFSSHPTLSDFLIDSLIEKGISIIGIDAGGIKRGKEHTPKDCYCADRGVFVVENLCNLGSLTELNAPFTLHTYPLRFSGITGMPSRVLAETE